MWNLFAHDSAVWLMDVNGIESNLLHGKTSRRPRIYPSLPFVNCCSFLVETQVFLWYFHMLWGTWVPRTKCLRAYSVQCNCWLQSLCVGLLLCFTPPCVAVRLIASKRKQCGAQQRGLLVDVGVFGRYIVASRILRHKPTRIALVEQLLKNILFSLLYYFALALPQGLQTFTTDRVR